jgi:uncharacterized membrane protein YhaH (DUF805 family)
MAAERFQHVNWLGLAFRPLREMFVFTGRSTRSEVVAFFILGVFANMSIVTIVSSGALGWFLATIKLGWKLLWRFPWIALFVRRLHDQGRSGWWALLLVAPLTATLVSTVIAPLIIPGVAQEIERRGALDWPVVMPSQPVSAVALAIYLLSCVALLVLFLLPGAEGSNRYGPDPRGTGQ